MSIQGVGPLYFILHFRLLQPELLHFRPSPSPSLAHLPWRSPAVCSSHPSTRLYSLLHCPVSPFILIKLARPTPSIHPVPAAVVAHACFALLPRSHQSISLFSSLVPSYFLGLLYVPDLPPAFYTQKENSPPHLHPHPPHPHQQDRIQSHTTQQTPRVEPRAPVDRDRVVARVDAGFEVIVLPIIEFGRVGEDR